MVNRRSDTDLGNTQSAPRGYSPFCNAMVYFCSRQEFPYSKGKLGPAHIKKETIGPTLGRSWLQDTLKRKLVDFAWNRRFFYLPDKCLPFFRVNPAKSFNQRNIFYPERLFLSVVGSASGKSWETGRGGGVHKKSKNRRVFFSRYLATNDGAK